MVVGITGGVGSGKSTFVRELARLGARVVDADRIAKRLIDEDAGVRRSLRKEFGTCIFDKRNRLRRRVLARKAFSNPILYRKLNQIMWPPMIRRIKASIQTGSGKKESVVVLDMAVLFESGAGGLTDKTVVICAARERRIRWAMQERGWSREETIQRMQFQLEDREKCRRADVVVRNTGSIGMLKKKAANFYHQIIVR